MDYSRRDFGKLALVGVPALKAMMSMKNRLRSMDGVRVGTITYSYNNDLPARSWARSNRRNHSRFAKQPEWA